MDQKQKAVPMLVLSATTKARDEVMLGMTACARTGPEEYIAKTKNTIATRDNLRHAKVNLGPRVYGSALAARANMLLSRKSELAPKSTKTENGGGL